MVRKSKKADADYMRKYRKRVDHLIFELHWRIRLHSDATLEKQRHGNKAFEVKEDPGSKDRISKFPKYIRDRVIPQMKKELPDVPTVWIEKQLAEYTKDPFVRSSQKTSDAFTRLCEYWRKK